MSDFERFTEFLRREARGYNEAPRVPVEVMWRGVEERIGGGLRAATDGARELAGVAGGAVGGLDGGATGGTVFDALGYNEAPVAPREEMWERIEAATGGSAGTDAVSGLPSGPQSLPWRWPSVRRRPGQRRVAGWAAALAAAASLVLGIVLGRDGGPVRPGAVTTDAAVPELPAEPTALPPSLAGSVQPTQSSDTETASGAPSPDAQPVLVAGLPPVPTATADPRTALATGDGAPLVARFAEDTPPERPAVFSSPSRLRRDAETTRYLGRAETLLTAFRIDQRTPASELDLARWARELLIETRMRLDLPVSRTPAESALLEDLELILLQMSRLGSGVSDVEWQLARETVELKGTLPKLRAVSATDGL